MDRVVPVWSFRGEAGDQQAVCLDHDFWVGRLHGEDEGMVVVVTGDAGELEGAFDHAEWAIAVAIHDAVRE